MVAARRPVTLVAAAVLLVSVITIAGSAAAPASAAAAPSEVTVIPPDPTQLQIPTDNILFAGATGFLHTYIPAPSQFFRYLWTSYATGTTTPVSALANAPNTSVQPAGSDSICIIWPVGQVTEVNLTAMTAQAYTIPSGYTVLGLAGSTMLAHNQTTGAVDLLAFAADGTTVMSVTPVSGLPTGATVTRSILDPADGTDIVARFTAGGTAGVALIDVATGEAYPVPGLTVAPTQLTLSASSLLAYFQSAGTVSVYSRAAITGGSATPQTATLPAGTYRVALAGQDVIAVPTTLPTSGMASAIALPLAGGAASTALPGAQVGVQGLAQAPDGALVVGGTGVSDWSVRKLSTKADGSLADSVVAPLTQLSNAGLTISEGLVRHLEATPVAPLFQLFNHRLTPDNGWNSFAADPSVGSGTLYNPQPCAVGALCVRMVDGSSYGPIYLVPFGGGQLGLYWYDQTAADFSLPSGSGTLVDVSSNYAIVDLAPYGSAAATQDVVHVGYGQIVSSGPVTGAGLWFDTLWQATAPGQLQSELLGPMTAGTTISTGSGCTATDVQATQRWIYWTCGTAGPAGVYDLQNNVDISVPAGPALLGDGYVVRHDPATGDLVMYDVHTDTAVGPVTLATGVAAGPAPDDRNITWAVDKYSGDVAYVDSGDAVHVVDTGVPSAGPAIGWPTADQIQQQSVQDFNSPQGGFIPLEVTRPITGWTATITKVSTGKIVHTETGGPASVGLDVTWNDLLPSGQKAFSGAYQWSLAVTSADSATPVPVASGPLQVSCGQIPFRSVDCNGTSALLSVSSNSDGIWYEGTASGTLRSNGYTENWPLCSYGYGGNCVTSILPFGDFNGDGYADLLVLYHDGSLRASLGIGQADFNSQTATSVFIGPGWTVYKSVVYVGNKTGSGGLQLLGIDASGELWGYVRTGPSMFSARSFIGPGWNIYTRVIGAGDLNGDGIGDLLAVDGSGVMWVYYGNGNGGFGARYRVGPGWSSMTAVIGIGDLNNDGTDDLVARGPAGELWLYPGNGAGNFGSAVDLQLNLKAAALF